MSALGFWFSVWVAGHVSAPAGEPAALRSLIDKTCTNCHDAQDDLNLEVPLAAWVGRAGASGRPMIVAGQPEASYLYRKVVGGAGMQGALMPIGSDPWSTAQVAMLRDYIVQLGAPPKSEPSPRGVAPVKVPDTGEKNRSPTPRRPSKATHSPSATAKKAGSGPSAKTPSSGAPSEVRPGSGSSSLTTPSSDPGRSRDATVGLDGPRPSAVAPVPGPPGGGNSGTKSPSPGDHSEVFVAPAFVPAGPAKVPPRPAAPLGTHQVNLHTTTMLPARRLEMRIHHRFSRIGKPGEGRYFGLGVSEGMTMSIGVGYGITDALDVLLRFSNERKDWELGAKYLLLDRKCYPLSLSLFASAEWLSESPKVAANRFTGTGQLLLTRDLGRWVWLSAGAGYALRTNHHPNPKIWIVRNAGEAKQWYSIKDTRSTLNALMAASVFVNKRRSWSVDLEYILPIPVGGSPDRFFYRGGDADPGGTKIGSWSLGTSIKLGLHLFQVFVTNTQSIHTNLVSSGGDTKNPFSPFGDMFLGFNLTRQWKL